ncbi:MAG: Ig-like domain-containing protein, partial [Haloglomus sp.]
GVSEVVGAILIFGLVLAVLALIQLSAVPAANQQIEFEHSQRIAGDFQRLDENVERVAATGAARSTRIEAGVRYPPRIFLLNPPPVSGTLRTGNTGDIVLENVRAQDPETADYWTGTDARQSQSRETVSLSYRAKYNEYASNPTIHYETGLLYREFRNSNEEIVVDASSIVSGRRIDLTVLDGSLSTSSVNEVTLNAQPVSAPTQEISVTGSGEPIRITVPTKLSEEKWVSEILNTEIDNSGNPTSGLTSCSDIDTSSLDTTNNRYVADCSYASGQITLVMEPGRTYGLRMAKVGLGDVFEEESPFYLTTVEGDDSSITDAQSQQVTVQVRDRFNNPVGGVEIEFDAGTNGTFLANDQSTVTVTADENGEATAVFESDKMGDLTVDARGTRNGGDLGDSGNGVQDYEFVTFDVGVSSSTIGDGDGEVGRPDRLQDINTREEDIYIEQATLVSGTNTTIDVTLRNQGTSERVMQTGRIAFVLATGDPNSATLTNTTGAPNYGTLVVGQSLEDFDNTISVPPGGTRTVRFTFDDTLEQSGGMGKTFDTFFVFSARIVTPNPSDPDNPTDGVTQTFFISDGIGTNTS